MSTIKYFDELIKNKNAQKTKLNSSKQLFLKRKAILHKNETTQLKTVISKKIDYAPLVVKNIGEMLFGSEDGDVIKYMIN